jgi:hypothetical protein
VVIRFFPVDSGGAFLDDFFEDRQQVFFSLFFFLFFGEKCSLQNVCYLARNPGIFALLAGAGIDQL